ncbi:MAG TPA: MFS transporter [Thermoanaerobaculia bacterium]|nr:MFS transporter [Thermoanaerobaculia bacterium]
MLNVRLLYVLATLRGLRFGLAVYVLYCLRLTDYAGIGLVETVSVATAFAMEIPTGVAADRWGRKRCLAGSFAIEVAGYLLFAAASSLGGLVGSLFVIQLGRALHSGTFEAMLWESLDERDRARGYVRVLGRANALGLAAFAGACLTGGFLYDIDPRLPYLAAAGAFAIAAGVALGLDEPPRATTTREGRSTEAVAVLAREWRLTLPVLLVGVFLVVSDELLDEVLVVEFGFPPRGLGALFAGAYLAAAAAAHFSDRLERRLGRRRLLFGMALVGAATLAASPRLGLLGGGVGFLLRHALRSVHDTVVAGQLVAAVDPGQRATVLSIYNAARSLPYVGLAWGLGAAMDAVTARRFALWFGLAMAAAAVAAWRISLADRRSTRW